MPLSPEFWSVELDVPVDLVPAKLAAVLAELLGGAI